MSRCINGTLISTATNNLGKVSAETLKAAHSQQESGRAIGKNAHDGFHQAGIAIGGVMRPLDADLWDLETMPTRSDASHEAVRHVRRSLGSTSNEFSSCR